MTYYLHNVDSTVQMFEVGQVLKMLKKNYI